MTEKPQTRPYDAAVYLETGEDCSLYLQAAIEESNGDPAIVVAALGDITRAHAILKLAQP